MSLHAAAFPTRLQVILSQVDKPRNISYKGATDLVTTYVKTFNQSIRSFSMIDDAQCRRLTTQTPCSGFTLSLVG